MISLLYYSNITNDNYILKSVLAHS